MLKVVQREEDQRDRLKSEIVNNIINLGDLKDLISKLSIGQQI